jgi:hypothetical protein
LKHFLTLTAMRIRLTLRNKMFLFFSVIMPFGFFFLYASVSAVWIEAVSLACWAILAFFVAAQLFRWEPESKIPRNAKLWAAATALPFLLLGVWENHQGTLLLQAQSAFFQLEHPEKYNQSPMQHMQPPPTDPQETPQKPF